MKEIVSHAAPKVVTKIQFSRLNPQQVVQLSEFEVTHKDLYIPEDHVPAKNGPLDRRPVRALACDEP
ncbi:hypothetical protein EXIGLDRAFT_764099 [Exidia glandulosa HHB12029]|uniref:DNA-directed RNA polymerase n=1 Tax=Exidia glandulosa HHB12029 TaxID=1314781 RepID=A0A165LDW3_EXIGL|nr:hypothetical protein EXIGLDRAFT_764099 [Exidia glandulosa HHB12029]